MVPAAFSLQVVISAAARWVAPAHLNINVAHEVWPPIAGWFDGIWLYQLLNFTLCIVLLQTGYALCRRVGLVEAADGRLVDDHIEQQ